MYTYVQTFIHAYCFFSTELHPLACRQNAGWQPGQKVDESFSTLNRKQLLTLKHKWKSICGKRTETGESFLVDLCVAITSLGDGSGLHSKYLKVCQCKLGTF